MRIRDLENVKNSEFLEAAIARDTNFARVASKYTDTLFTERGFEAVTRENLNFTSDFLGLTIRIAFDLLKTETNRNPLETTYSDIVRRTNYTYGGIIQRIYVRYPNAVDPAWVGLKNGDWVNPDIIRMLETDESFWQTNASWADWITIPEDFQIRPVFLEERGIGLWVAAQMEKLYFTYRDWESTNLDRAMEAALTSENNPLQKTQVITMDSWTDGGTDAELRDNFLATLQDLADLMSVTRSSGAFNSAKYRKAPEPSRMTLLVRAPLLTKIKRNLITGAYNPENLAINGFKLRGTDHFGVTKPYIMIVPEGETEPVKTYLYPVYSEYGERIGFATTENATEVEYGLYDEDIVMEDQHPEILALIIEDEFITINDVEAMKVVPYVPNPRSRTQNIHAMQANRTYLLDYHMDFIEIVKPDETDGGGE